MYMHVHVWEKLGILYIDLVVVGFDWFIYKAGQVMSKILAWGAKEREREGGGGIRCAEIIIRMLMKARMLEEEDTDGDEEDVDDDEEDVG